MARPLSQHAGFETLELEEVESYPLLYCVFLSRHTKGSRSQKLLAGESAFNSPHCRRLHSNEVNILPCFFCDAPQPVDMKGACLLLKLITRLPR